MPTKTRKTKTPTTPDTAGDVDEGAQVVDLASRRGGQDRPPRVLMELPLDQLEPDAENVRLALRDIDSLALSIAEVGVLEPILVIPGDVDTEGTPRWRIWAGHRRRAAATKAGLATVPCLEHTGARTDVDRLEVQLVENLQRDDLTPIEEARGYQDLVAAGRSQRQVAARVGCNQSHVSKRLKLLTLPAKCHTMLAAGELTVEDALTLTALVDHPERISEAIALTKPSEKYDWAQCDTMAEAVEDQLKIVEHQQLRLAAFAELDAGGIRIVDWPKGGGYSGWPAGHRRLDTGNWPGHKAPTKAKVKKGGHLAAAVDERGNVVYLCTDYTRYETQPGNGSSTGGASAAGAASGKAAAAALNKRRREDAKRRLSVAGRFVRNAAPGRDAAIAEVVAGDRRLGKGTSIWLTSILGTWLELCGYMRSGPTRIARELLDVDKGVSLPRLAHEPEFTGRVELACWIGLAEERIEMQDLVHPLVTGYYRWLAELRYELGPDEHHDLEQALGRVKTKTAVAS